MYDTYNACFIYFKLFSSMLNIMPVLWSTIHAKAQILRFQGMFDQMPSGAKLINYYKCS